MRGAGFTRPFAGKRFPPHAGKVEADPVVPHMLSGKRILQVCDRPFQAVWVISQEPERYVA